MDTIEATARQAAHFVSLMQHKNREDLQTLITSGLLTDLMNADPAKVDRYKFRKFLGLEPDLHIIVDHTKTIETRLDEPRFYWERPKVEKPVFSRFEPSYRSSVKRECRLFVPTKRVFSVLDGDGMIRDADFDNPWRPAELEDMIAFARAYPDLGTAAVIALGSSIKLPYLGHKEDVRDYYPCMSWGGGAPGNQPKLGLTVAEYRDDIGHPAWKQGFRLLAVRDLPADK